MNKRSIRYKDTWAAPGSRLHAALEDGNKKLAEQIYQECERDRAKLEGARNQCDGCVKGDAISERGHHVDRYGKSYMGCEAGKYAP
jgi:hypothetical protein